MLDGVHLEMFTDVLERVEKVICDLCKARLSNTLDQWMVETVRREELKLPPKKFKPKRGSIFSPFAGLNRIPDALCDACHEKAQYAFQEWMEEEFGSNSRGGRRRGPRN